MGDEEMLSVVSKCFAPVDEGEWAEIVSAPLWSEFLDAARRRLQDEQRLGDPLSFRTKMRSRCPLQDFLSAGEVDALFRPPSFEEKRSFAARHFTGGLATSALPVESLYCRDAKRVVGGTVLSRESAYMGNSALYMRETIERMGLSVPPEFVACPDHLSLELDLAAVLLRSGMAQEANAFFVERFEWLGRFRMRLIDLGDQASFYVGLVDVLVGMRALLSEMETVA